ncbi:MAG: preprotein translocase subunit SecG [Candidatus Eutrophobiaceae bacterium]
MLVAVSLVGLILLQHGKGADAGAAFGSGASATVFGSRGSRSFLSRLTSILAGVFLANGLLLAYVATDLIQSQKGSVLDVSEESGLKEEGASSPMPLVDSSLGVGADDLPPIDGASDQPSSVTVSPLVGESADRQVDSAVAPVTEAILEDMPPSAVIEPSQGKDLLDEEDMPPLSTGDAARDVPFEVNPELVEEPPAGLRE